MTHPIVRFHHGELRTPFLRSPALLGHPPSCLAWPLPIAGYTYFNTPPHRSKIICKKLHQSFITRSVGLCIRHAAPPPPLRRPRCRPRGRPRSRRVTTTGGPSSLHVRRSDASPHLVALGGFKTHGERVYLVNAWVQNCPTITHLRGQNTN